MHHGDLSLLREVAEKQGIQADYLFFDNPLKSGVINEPNQIAGPNFETNKRALEIIPYVLKPQGEAWLLALTGLLQGMAGHTLGKKPSSLGDMWTIAHVRDFVPPGLSIDFQSAVCLDSNRNGYSRHIGPYRESNWWVDFYELVNLKKI